MGERSKALGEQGEKIVEYLFNELLGHSPYRQNIDIQCSYEKDHSRKEGSLRKTHGIDGLISYHNPLKDRCLEIGLISSKFTGDSYPNSPRTKFREYFKDLAWAMQCFRHSDEKSEIESNAGNVDKTEITGVLFWLSNHDDSHNTDLLEDAAKSEFGSDSLVFEKLIFVDNARVNFLYNLLKPIFKEVGQENVNFVYPRTGFNNLPEFNEGFGKKFPLDFFAYDIIPLRITKSNQVHLYLACRKPFDTEELIKIIGLAKSFNHLGATSKTFIGFPNYNRSEHLDSARRIIASLKDSTFGQQVEIINNNDDFRNE